MADHADNRTPERTGDAELWRQIRADIEPHAPNSADMENFRRVFDGLRACAPDADPPRGWASVRSRIAAATSARRRVRSPFAWALAACLTLATVASLYHAASLRDEVHRLRHQLAATVLAPPKTLTAEEATASLAMFDEVRSYYEGHAEWVALTGSRVHLGLTDRPGANASRGTNAAVIRIAMTDGADHPELTTDVVTRWGVTSAFRNTVGDTLVVEYEATPRKTSNGMVLVRVHLQASSTYEADVTAAGELMGTLLLRPGESQPLGAINTAAGIRHVTVSAQWERDDNNPGQPV